MDAISDDEYIVCRRVKISNQLRMQDIMDPRYEREPLGAVAGVCDGPDQSGTPPQDEYLAAENRILRAHLPARLRLSDPERSTLAEIGKRLGRKALAQVACVAKPDTILAWYRKLIAKKFDGSKHRRYPGRPGIEPKLEELIVKMARENSGWVTTELWARCPTSAIPSRIRL